MKQTGQTLILNGGVNLNRDPRKISPYQLALSKNAYPITQGINSKRNGFSAANIAIATGGSRTAFINSWAVAPTQTGLTYVADVHIGAASDANRRRILIASNFDKEIATSPVGITIDIGQLASDYEPTRFVNYRGSVIAIVPGIEGYYGLQRKTTGAGYEWYKNSFAADPSLVVFDVGPPVVPFSQGIPVMPRNGAVYKQRMVWGNFGPGMGSWLCWADIATDKVFARNNGFELPSIIGVDALALNGRHVEVGAIEGEDITAMREVTLSAVGSAIDSILMVLTERSCVFISGEILNSGAADASDPSGLFGSYNENRVNYECGCVSADTLVKTPYGWLWAGPDDVWILRGNLPERIGTNIRPALMNCPAGSKKHWSAAYSNGIYVLQLVTTSTVASDLNSNVTVHQHEYWYLDLREGGPSSAEEALWYGPMVNELDVNSNVVYGKLLSVKDRDGSDRILVPGQILDTAPAAHRDCILYNVLVGGGKDDLLPPTVTGNEWQPNVNYRLGDVVRPRINSATAGRTGFLHVCTAAYRQLNYDTEVAPFTVGETVTSNTGATALVEAVVDNGSSGILFLSTFTGDENFPDNGTILGSLGGIAQADGTTYEGLSGANDPTWAITSGGATTDNGIRWQEIRGVNENYGVRLETGRSVGSFTADIRAIDDLLNDSTHEKLVRRVDAIIAASNKIAITCTALRDQGNEPKGLGTNIFGGEALRGDVSTIGSVIGGLKSRAKAFRPDETELIQCRTAQIKFTDETSYVIDETNNYLIVGFATASIPSLVLQVEIPQGQYESINTLLEAIVTALNSNGVPAALTAAGMTVGADPWSYVDAYAGVHPYFTRLRLTTSGAGSYVSGLLWGTLDGDQTVAAGSIANDLTKTTLHFGRCKSLIASLGFDTTLAGTPRAYVSSNLFTFDGVQVVHLYNNAKFELINAVVVVQPKGAIPFKGKNRS